ncbi:hypothetical protein LAZ67_23000912 [Cordylochernes scorpioides]|uniref:Uncharacterized protein n=1 Tax=Cordylochernes scorpioides TaxID=51811 RepID=A0ABY6LQB8_9ARAC|nr:hypothetical protein LAZ67_23000912 [Cordylochernes scorpioides]
MKLAVVFVLCFITVASAQMDIWGQVGGVIIKNLSTLTVTSIWIANQRQQLPIMETYGLNDHTRPLLFQDGVKTFQQCTISRTKEASPDHLLEGMLWQSGNFELMGHNCHFKVSPKISKFKLKYKGKLWCPGWTGITGRSTKKSRSGAIEHSVRDFVNQAKNSAQTHITRACGSTSKHYLRVGDFDDLKFGNYDFIVLKNDQLCFLENSDHLLIKYLSSTEGSIVTYSEIVDHLSGKSVVVLDETKQL